MTTHAELVSLCAEFEAAHEQLGEVADEIREAHRKIVKQRLRQLRHRVAKVDEAREALRDALAEAVAEGLFEKPRTRAVGAVKIGLRKKPGKLAVADEARTIELIGRKMPDRRAALVKTAETVVKAALKNLSVRECASIGVVLEEDQDELVIRMSSDDVDKLVATLLADVDDE